MANFYGADVEQLRMLSREFEHNATELEALVSRLGSRVSSVAWQGPDARKFSSDWNDRLSGSIRNVAQTLREASERAAGNARDQEATSGVSGSGGFTLPGDVPALLLPHLGIMPDPVVPESPGMHLPDGIGELGPFPDLPGVHVPDGGASPAPYFPGDPVVPPAFDIPGHIGDPIAEALKGLKDIKNLEATN